MYVSNCNRNLPFFFVLVAALSSIIDIHTKSQFKSLQEFRVKAKDRAASTIFVAWLVVDSNVLQGWYFIDLIDVLGRSRVLSAR